MKIDLNRFPVYALVFPAIIGGTLLLLFGAAFFDGVVYPIFRKIAYMNVQEREYSIQFEELEGLELSEEERFDVRKKVVSEYKQLYGSKYEDRLKGDIAGARAELGNAAYERVWGDILEDFDKEEKK